jgi:hypothetical protein
MRIRCKIVKPIVAMVVCFVIMGLALVMGSPALATSNCAPPRRIGSDHTNVGELETHKMSCASARAAIAHGRLTHSGNLKTTGFACHVVRRYSPNAGVITGAKIHCRRGPRQFAFAWAT